MLTPSSIWHKQMPLGMHSIEGSLELTLTNLTLLSEYITLAPEQ